jgi:phenylalanyl-tRNA synthetase beta chain
LPGVLKTASRNNARRNNDLLIFEVGAVFIPQGEELPNEVNTLAVLGCGQASKNWYSAGDNFDFFRLKGMLEAILSDCRITDASFKPCSDLPYMHPGRTAALYLGDEYAGYIGELHPQIQRNYEIKQRSVVLEINLDVLFEHVGEISQYQSLPKFPAAVRDIAVVLDKKVSAAELEAAIAKAGGKHLVDISLFDVYENISLGLGRRSLAYNLTFQCPDRTLTVEEVNEAFEDILIAVQELGGELRS